MVKFSKSLVGDRRKKNLLKMETIHFPLRIGYFATVNPFLDDDCSILVAMISSEEQRSLVQVAVASASAVELCPKNNRTSHKR